MNKKLSVILIGLMIVSLVTVFPIKVNASTTDHVPLQEWVTGWNNKVAISADGNYTVVGDTSGYISLFHKDSETRLWMFDADAPINEVDISADGMYLVAGDTFGYMWFFNRTSNVPMWIFDAEDLVGVSISATGFYVTGGDSSGLSLFNRTSNSPCWSDGPSVDGVISADGRYVCTKIATGIRLINTSSGTSFWSKYNIGYFSDPKISADGQYILATNPTRLIRNTTYLLDNAGSFIWNYTSPSQQWASDMSEDGVHILIADLAGKVALLNNTSNSTIWSDTFSGNDPRIRISADGNYFAVGNGNNLYLYNTTTQALLWTALASYSAKSLDMSANGDYIVLGSDLHTYLFHRVNEPSPEDGGPGIPGFELMGVLIAALVASIWSINRRKFSEI
ncbi:MAG: PQQ-like beta-propeller repeat protein [Candidatus Helarchaeota archaeon]|nr:PQQ-like beta-propeller repeat protein [Candidatus Helarchaeota archaeon]